MKHQHRCFPLNFTKFLARPTFVEHLQTAVFGNANLWGCNPTSKTMRKIHMVSRLTKLLNYLFKFDHLGWYYYPCNLWNLSSMSMMERANGKYCRANIVDQSFTVFYFMTWNRNISIRTWNISLSYFRCYAIVETCKNVR